ncbi:MAG: alkaline phosphatase family protein [Acidobacteriota bacterium]
MRKNNHPVHVLDITLAAAIRRAYTLGQEDETLEPIVKADRSGRPLGRLGEGDYIIFYDIRGEREIELTQSLMASDFPHFPREKLLRLHFVTMITYDPELDVKVAFPTDDKIKNTLAEVVSRAGIGLAKVSESEKSVHVGYFMNGKREDIFPGETRFVIPSPHDVDNYAETPGMSAAAVAEKVVSVVDVPDFAVIIANLANVDVVGHIENRTAVIKAVEAVDAALGRIAARCRERGVTFVVTSDHGTVEEWLYPDGQVNTGHTKNPVPIILADYSPEAEKRLTLKNRGELADVAPTILDLLGLKRPAEMTGESLVTPRSLRQARRRKIVLLILDGWGLREEAYGNIIREARTPHFDKLWAAFPHALLQASGKAVGMPPDTVGNSEAGHLHLGAGRRILLDRLKIDQAIQNKDFFKNPAFLWAMRGARHDQKALHLMGIVSHYSSHGTLRHLFPLLQMAREQGVAKVFIHCFIGRRGEKPESGAIYVEKVEEKARQLGVGEVVTVLGRFWALDREQNWDRVEKTYRALVQGEGTRVAG